MEMATNEDTSRFADLCRLCATKTSVLIGINIFESEGNVRQISKKIQSCLPIQVLETDDLPKMICDSCLCKLELFSDFRERSLKAEKILIDLVKESVQQNDLISSLDHNDLIMVQHPLLDQSLHNVTDMDISNLGQRESMIVEQTLNGIVIHNNELGTELSGNLQIDHNGQSFTNENLSLIQQSHILSEHFRLQQNIVLGVDENVIAVPNIQASKHIQEKFQQEQNFEERDNIENSINDKIIEDNLMNKNLNKALYIVDKEESLQMKKDVKDFFYCNICSSAFDFKPAFDSHYETHFFKCSLCLAVFSNSDSLNLHRKEAHNARNEDDKTFDEETPKTDSPQSLQIAGDQECDSNQIEADDDVDAEVDLKSKDWSVKGCKSPKVCKECGKAYKTNYKLNEHMRKHTGEKPYKCGSCDKAFRSKIGLAQHEAKHTGHYDYSCPTCGKGFQCKSYLIVHQRVHSDVKPYPCTTCGQNFKTKQSLLDHTNRHLGLKPYMCETCGRGFITKGLCKAHQKVHTGLDNRKYSCKICSKMFVSKSYLQTHLRIHTGEKPFICEVCGKGFLTRVDLKIHSTMHTGEKSFVCEICGKAFARRDALRCHRRSHTGERPYSCDICGQTFTQFTPMAIHKRLHTGERPYKCETCGKCFVSKSTMMAHAKKHTR